MSDRRSFVIGVGGAILGGAAFSNTAAAAATDEGTYAVGLVCEPGLGRPARSAAAQRLSRPVAKPAQGTGSLSDPIYPNVNTHSDILRTVAATSKTPVPLV